LTGKVKVHKVHTKEPQKCVLSGIIIPASIVEHMEPPEGMIPAAWFDQIHLQIIKEPRVAIGYLGMCRTELCHRRPHYDGVLFLAIHSAQLTSSSLIISRSSMLKLSRNRTRFWHVQRALGAISPSKPRKAAASAISCVR